VVTNDINSRLIQYQLVDLHENILSSSYSQSKFITTKGPSAYQAESPFGELAHLDIVKVCE